MKIITVLGTRPEILRLSKWETEVIFTGQHQDFEMSGQFIESDKVERTIHYLDSETDFSSLDSITKQLKKKLWLLGNVDIVIVHGDTRSAMAGAIVAQDMNIVLAHTEAGVRCYLDTIEERYRTRIDLLANYNFCPIPQAVENLKKENIIEGVYFVGDTLYDKFLEEKGCWDFTFVTIHRQENIENKDKLVMLIDSLKDYGRVVFSIHPHTRKCLEKFDIKLPNNVMEFPPMDHKKTLRYINDAKLVLTDSGGIQREAYWSGTPCKIARANSEWNLAVNNFGNGTAGERIKKILEEKQPYRRVKECQK